MQLNRDKYFVLFKGLPNNSDVFHIFIRTLRIFKYHGLFWIIADLFIFFLIRNSDFYGFLFGPLVSKNR